MWPAGPWEGRLDDPGPPGAECLPAAGGRTFPSGRDCRPHATPLGRDSVFDELLTALKEGPILLLGAAFLLALLGYALVKRLLKMALFLVVFIAIYLGLLYVLGYEIPELPF